MDVPVVLYSGERLQTGRQARQRVPERRSSCGRKGVAKL